MHDLLIQNIKELVPLNERESLLIRDAFEPVTLKKKQFLLQSGEYSKHMRFIADSCLKLFNIDEAGNEHILQFGIKGWWMNDLCAYLTQKLTAYYIQAISDSVVLQIHRVRLDELFDQIQMMDRFFRIKTQNGYVALQERSMHAMSQTSEQRYADFVKRYRTIEQQIPQYMIASYLGISPEHLSTIRKKISSQGFS